MAEAFRTRNFLGRPGPSLLNKLDFGQPPDRLGPEHLRRFQAHLFRERKLDARTVVQYSAGLRFFFVKTLKRHDLLESIPLPKEPRKLPTVLSQGEVTRLIESASNLMHRAILMTLYPTGMCRAARVLALDEAQDLLVPRHGK